MTTDKLRACWPLRAQMFSNRWLLIFCVDVNRNNPVQVGSCCCCWAMLHLPGSQAARLLSSTVHTRERPGRPIASVTALPTHQVLKVYDVLPAADAKKREQWVRRLQGALATYSRWGAGPGPGRGLAGGLAARWVGPRPAVGPG
jgi:hypothetical protein